jgi:uncharacterized protein (DUF1800 family)
VIWQWLDVHLWGPMWPNIFSPNIWSLAAIAAHLAVSMVQREQQHRDAMKEAKAARKIAADLHERMTGEAHPDAPAKPESEAK